MNVTFWLLASVLLACFFIIIIPPLWKKRQIKDTDAEQRNVNIAQDRAIDLKQQLAAGALTQQQFNEQYEELELSLGDDLDNDQHHDVKASFSRWVIPVIVIAAPLFSILLYFSLGEPDALEKAKWQQAQQSATPTQEDINAMVNGLAQRLQNEPNDAEGWLMLGRSYKYMKKPVEAVKAFERAYALLGDQPEILLQYADALAMANGGKISGKSAQLIFKALELSPDNEMALWLGGMAKAEIGQFAEATQYWQKLEKLLPPDSASLKELQGMMASLPNQSDAVQTVKTKAVEPQKNAISINVQVSINKTLASKVSLTDTVFIYAKALTGPPMPLAIVRKQVADLPVSITLNDAMAMMPAMKLSNFKQVKVVARVSKSGTAMPQKGDYIGSVELKAMSAETAVLIVINEEI